METTDLQPARAQFASEKTTEPPSQQDQKMRRIMIGVIIGVIVLLILLGVAIFFLLQPSTPTDKIRDVFIIVVALESLVIGVAVIILIVQLATLINLLQNEVRPILTATNETVNHLRGTAEFLGENVVEPVIKLNGYLAGMNRVIELMGIKKK
jgi:amino acid transporter